jgi:hypothetical protein|tara:strand:- start:966 stop:1136 length:171 start_codon:yes stop_codon:yes gene_type:complete
MHDKEELIKLILQGKKLINDRRTNSNVFNMDLRALNILEQIIYYIQPEESKGFEEN